MAKMKSTVGILAVLTAAAAAIPAEAQRRGDINPTLNSVNQPVVQRTDYVYDMAVGQPGVAAFDLDRLSNWFDSLRLRYGDRVYVDEGQGYRDARVRQQIADVAADYGILLADGTPVTAGAVQPGAVRVIVSRAVASVPGCPNWSEAGEIGNRITTGSNYGCSINSNLAAMIADPNDLVLGQEVDGSGDPVSTTKAIKHYRDTAPTGGTLEASSAKGGK